MRRLAIFIAALGFVFYVHEIAARAQHGPSRIPRIRETARSHWTRGHDAGTNRTIESKTPNYGNTRLSLNDQLSRNSKLSTRLQGLLGGRDLQEAADGFKNLGQFIAAVHVSNNLGISFDDLKLSMTDPDSPKSLGKAVQELRPEADAANEVNKANDQAADDLEKTSQ